MKFPKLFGGLKNDLKDKEKKTLPTIVLLFAVGVVMLLIIPLISDYLFPAAQIPPSYAGGLSTQQTAACSNLDEHVKRLEQRLEEILGLVDGAGRVRVMITASRGRELIVAQTWQHESSVTQEEDSAGGTRNSETLREQGAYVFARRHDGSETPLVLTELEPRIEGVAIVAEGGDDIAVKDALTRTAAAALGVGIHRVQVVTMNR